MADEHENTGPVDAVNGDLLPARVQPHGGQLRTGNPGNKGGGRPKESLRRRMRRILGKTLTAIENDLDELAATDGASGVLANQGKDGPEHGPLTRADAVKIALVAAKYGVGTEDKREIEKTTARYIFHLPARVSRAANAANLEPVTVVPPPALPALDSESTAARGE